MDGINHLLEDSGMEQAWTYKRGTWSTTTSPIALTDGDGDQLDEVEGYSPDTLWLGLEGGLQVEVYTKLKDNPTAAMPYLVIVYLGGDNRDYIYVEDLPSLLQLMNMMAPIIQCSNEDIEAERDEDDDEDEFDGGDGAGDEHR
jgi:hypothetical protein